MELGLLEPGHRDRRELVACEEHIEPLDDRPRKDQRDAEDGDGEREPPGSEAERDALGPFLDRLDGEGGESAADVELRELGGCPIVERMPRGRR